MNKCVWCLLQRHTYIFRQLKFLHIRRFYFGQAFYNGASCSLYAHCAHCSFAHSIYSIRHFAKTGEEGFSVKQIYG